MRATDPDPESRRRRDRSPLIPDALWPNVGWVLGVLAVVIAVFAALTTGDDKAHPLEEWVIDLLRGRNSPTLLWDLGLAYGSPAFFVAVVAALAIWAFTRRNWPALVACAAVPGAVVLVEQILKPIVDRRYVWGLGEHYYPSGTVTGVAAWTTLTWLLAAPRLRTSRARRVLGFALGGLTVLTAFSVVGADRHFPFDAIGGVATGTGVVLACCAVIDRVTGAHVTPRRGRRGRGRSRVSRG
jgi:membrane-associated phospholipid phosphatase